VGGARTRGKLKEIMDLTPETKCKFFSSECRNADGSMIPLNIVEFDGEKYCETHMLTTLDKEIADTDKELVELSKEHENEE